MVGFAFVEVFNAVYILVLCEITLANSWGELTWDDDLVDTKLFIL